MVQLYDANKDIVVVSSPGKAKSEGYLNTTETKKSRPDWDRMLYIINGKEYNNDMLKDYTIETEEDLVQFDPEEAVKKYGEKGKYGALVFNGKSTFKKNKDVENAKPRAVRIKNGEDIVFYDDNRMKVPGEPSVIFKADGPELIIDDVKQSNPEAAMKGLDVMKIKNIDIISKPDGEKQIIIKTE